MSNLYGLNRTMQITEINRTLKLSWDMTLIKDLVAGIWRASLSLVLFVPLLTLRPISYFQRTTEQQEHQISVDVLNVNNEFNHRCHIDDYRHYFWFNQLCLFNRYQTKMIRFKWSKHPLLKNYPEIHHSWKCSAFSKIWSVVMQIWPSSQHGALICIVTASVITYLLN